MLAPMLRTAKAALLVALLAAHQLAPMAEAQTACEAARFKFGTVQAAPADAAVSARFFLEDGCGQPVPFLHSSMFDVRVGADNRLITSQARQEGTVTLISGDHVVDATAKYMHLLLDASMTMDAAERARVLLAFIDTYLAASGETYMKIIAFSGRFELLTLTAACDEGFCNDTTVLHGVVNAMQASLSAWAYYDPHATAAYWAIRNVAADIGVVSQAHAEAKRAAAGGLRGYAVGTVDSLIVFTDLDDTAYSTTLQEAVSALSLVKSSIGGQVSLVVFDYPSWYPTTDPAVVANIDAARAAFAGALGADYVFRADDADVLIQAFNDLADKNDRKANAWYELLICPPTRSGTDHPLTIEVQGYDASLSATFDATGFGDQDSLDGRCAEQNVDAVEQAVETSFCESRQCGFFEGTFCGVCDVAVVLDAGNYQLHNEEAPVLQVPAGTGTERWEFRTTTTASPAVSPDPSAFADAPAMVTAHVGPNRVLVMPGGAGFGGVTIDAAMTVVRAPTSGAPEMLLHVIPQAGATWLRELGIVPPPPPTPTPGAVSWGLSTVPGCAVGSGIFLRKCVTGFETTTVCPVGCQAAIDDLYDVCDGEKLWEESKPTLKTIAETRGCGGDTGAAPAVFVALVAVASHVLN